jgi:hypothetical protein
MKCLLCGRHATSASRVVIAARLSLVLALVVAGIIAVLVLW